MGLDKYESKFTLLYFIFLCCVQKQHIPIPQSFIAVFQTLIILDDSVHNEIVYYCIIWTDEDLIKWGWPEDVWFHVDKFSSAHVYLRLQYVSNT